MKSDKFERKQLIDDIKYIKEIMSTSSHYTNLSGIAGIISGLCALAGCFISWFIGGHIVLAEGDINNLYQLILVWIVVFVISWLTQIYCVRRKARKTGKPVWDRLSKLIIYALSPPLLIGGCFTVFFILENKMLWIPGMWMITYGLGVWSAGLFSIKEPRWLGAFFILTGLMALFFFREQSLIILAISFGIYHIIYGTIIFLKYGD